MRITYFIPIVFSVLASVQAQDLSNLEAALSFYGDAMINTYEPNNRIHAADEFEKLFEEYVKQTDLYSAEAGFLKFISILDDEENTFKLISWQIQQEGGAYDYRAYLLKSDGTMTKFDRTEIIDKSFPFSSSTAKDWYGCQYYNIQRQKDNTYLLYGIDYNGEYDNTKIVDVLTLNGSEITLGSPIFEDKESPGTFVNRLMLSYSSDAAVSLNYNDALGLIIHDHMRPILGLQAGQGTTNIPDGTYEGYFLKDGKWHYKEKIFDHVYEEAPRPKPILNTQREVEGVTSEKKKK